MKERLLRALSLVALVFGIGVLWEVIEPNHAAHAQSGQANCPVGSGCPPTVCAGACTPPLECGCSRRTMLCQCA